MPPCARHACLVLALALPVACASAPAAAPSRGESPAVATAASPGERAARTALAQLGAPYRHGGRTPHGFDCSGLVVYSYARAGVTGLPRSAAALERHARPVALGELAPGDLLFFRLEKASRKASHVAIYVGGRSFVHAPSSGKRVERVSFDHVYWGPRVARAGRLAR